MSPKTGNIYVSDGYGNAKVHKFAPDGRHILSWGEPGIDPGQFIRTHNVVIDADDNIYIADREAHRVQVFDANGKYITHVEQYPPPRRHLPRQRGQLRRRQLNGMGGVDDAPNMGHRVTIYNLSGERIGLFGTPEEGEGPGQFIAPTAPPPTPAATCTWARSPSPYAVANGPTPRTPLLPEVRQSPLGAGSSTTRMR